jgi:hypothetical protein
MRDAQRYLELVRSQTELRLTGKRSNVKALRFVWRGVVGNTGKAVRWQSTRPMSSGGNARSSVARLYTDAIRSHEFAFCSWYALTDGR